VGEHIYVVLDRTSYGPASSNVSDKSIQFNLLPVMELYVVHLRNIKHKKSEEMKVIIRKKKYGNC
jgi:hypothetical protein